MNPELESQVQLIYIIVGFIAIVLFIVLVMFLIHKLIRWTLRKHYKELCANNNHKWIPVFIKGEYNNETVKFISCYCDRCRKGYTETLQINGVAKNREYGTYSEKYFDK